MRPRRQNYGAYAYGVFRVARRDLQSLLRASWSFLLLTVLVALLGLFSMYSLPRAAATSTAVSTYAAILFGSYTTYLYGVAIIILPGLAIIAVSAERKQNTLEQLQLTWLSPGQIIFGKTVAILFLYALLCAATLPVVGIVYFFAGVDLGTMLRLPLRLGPFSMCCAAMGIAASMRHKEPVLAWRYAVTYILILSIWPGLMSSIAVRLAPGSLAPMGIFAAYFLFCAAFALLLARRGLRVFMRFDGDAEWNPIPVPKRPGFRPMDPRRHDTLRSIDDRANPVRQKEAWTSRLCAGTYTGRLILLGLPVGMLTGSGLSRAGFVSGVGNQLGLPQLILVVMLLPALAVMMITQERDQGTLIQLRTTPLTAREVLGGKIGALLRAVFPAFFGVFLGDMFAVWTMSSSVPYGHSIPLIGAILAQDFIRFPALIIFVACLAQWGALIARNSLNAMVLGYGFALLGVVLFETLRGFAVRYAVIFLSGMGGYTAVIGICILDAALLLALGGGAFWCACYAYRRLPGE